MCCFTKSSAVNGQTDSRKRYYRIIYYKACTQCFQFALNQVRQLEIFLKDLALLTTNNVFTRLLYFKVSIIIINLFLCVILLMIFIEQCFLRAFALITQIDI